ncbi:MAG: twin-arginine translocase TatA/TatE family subunit, partial [Acidimicrobiia bacterium]
MGSLGTGELVVIVLVAIVVFGPRRLPELARKAAELIKQAREATQSFTDALDTEYDGVTAPLKELKAEYDETMQTIKKMAPVIPNMSFELPDGKPRRM